MLSLREIASRSMACLLVAVVVGGVVPRTSAQETTSQLQFKRPPELNAQYHRAEAAWQSGSSLLEAKTRVDKVLEVLPDDGPALKLRAKVLMELDRPDEALEDAQRAVAIDPRDGDAHLVLCHVARVLGRNTLAEEALMRAASLLVEDPAAHIHLSREAELLNRYDLAEAYARTAVLQVPDERSAHLQLARAFAIQGKSDESATILVKAFEADVLRSSDARRDSLLAPLMGLPRLQRYSRSNR